MDRCFELPFSTKKNKEKYSIYLVLYCSLNYGKSKNAGKTCTLYVFKWESDALGAGP